MNYTIKIGNDINTADRNGEFYRQRIPYTDCPRENENSILKTMSFSGMENINMNKEEIKQDCEEYISSQS